MLKDAYLLYNFLFICFDISSVTKAMSIIIKRSYNTFIFKILSLQRNHRLIAPLMIIVGAVVVLSGLGTLLSLFSLQIGKIISGALYFVIVAYFFLCYHTVYEKVRDEKINNL